MLIGGLLSAGASIIGGAMKSSADAKAADKQYANDMAAAEMQRQWNIEDRDEARAYDITQRDEARTYSRRVLGDLVTDAEKAGFNPLTVLRNGGGAGYNAAASFQPALSVPLSRTAPVRRAPTSYMGDAVASAGNRIGDFIADFDPFADDKRELESQLVGAQIANLNASTAAFRSQSFNVPTATAGTGRTVTTQRAGMLSKDAGRALVPEVETPKLTNPTRAGNDVWHVDPAQPDASAWEDRYGEPGSWIGGVWNFGTDALYNAGRGANRAWKAITSPRLSKAPPFRPYIENLPSISGR